MCRFWRRAGRQSEQRIVLYTRVGCHLCEDAWTLLCQLRDRHGFVLEVVDIDTEEPLRRLHGEQVPVVLVNGRVRFWGRINRVLVERLLRNEAR
jgi:glutaredoxin